MENEKKLGSGVSKTMLEEIKGMDVARGGDQLHPHKVVEVFWKSRHWPRTIAKREGKSAEEMQPITWPWKIVVRKRGIRIKL